MAMSCWYCIAFKVQHYLLPAGLREREPQLYLYCFYSVVQNGFFAPQWRHIAPTNVKFGTGERVRFPLPDFTFIEAEMWDTAPKTVKILNLGHKFAPQWRLLCTVFTKFSAFVYLSIGRFKVFNLVTFGGQATKLSAFFPWWGHFPQIFISP